MRCPGPSGHNFEHRIVRYVRTRKLLCLENDLTYTHIRQHTQACIVLYRVNRNSHTNFLYCDFLYKMVHNVFPVTLSFQDTGRREVE
jgi:hypothetical protein